MQLRSNIPLIFFVAVVITATVLFSSPTVSAQLRSFHFTNELDRIERIIDYKFQNIWYLRRAMTHSSYSDENNKDLSIIGLGIINATVARDTFTRRLNSSSKAVNDRLSMTNNENVCAAYGTFLRLESVVRVSASFDSSNSSILSGAFKALLGAIALDSGKIADAEKLFLGILDGASKVIVYYQFKNRELHLRALTHSSYSKENNKALSILGESIIETFAAMRSLTNDLYKSARESRDFNKIVKEAVVNKISKEAVEDCALSGKKLRLHEKVMVSSSTDASNPSVVCGAFKSMVGATALDSGEPDKAVNWMLVSLRGAFALDFPESD
ncbi:ribonuclease III domain-containing protein [Artemisia annua]|uniref:Ribonuclease III domain-containing protein n=1 Tax=Artemisia annua TaxID=35608 RepID=A0A2U1NXK4_ARTAN|nr:ribonuclease III domain-containing protein [Artemisia annua]